VASLCPKERRVDIDVALTIGGEGLAGQGHDNQTMVLGHTAFRGSGCSWRLVFMKIVDTTNFTNRKQANSASIAYRDALIQVCRAGK
jgi:hypothetical protein